MDVFWTEDPYILINKQRLIEFVPTNNMTTDEKLNAITRFSIYLGILLMLIYQNYRFLYITVIVAVLVTIIHDHYPNKTEQFVNNEDSLQRPTKNNPFMNVLLTDIADNPNRNPASDVDDPTVKKEIENNFNSGLYRDINNIWDRNNSQRQFYTNPATTVPNDRDSFMKWCYSTPYTCKDGNLSRCLRYEDVRSHGQIH